MNFCQTADNEESYQHIAENAADALTYIQISYALSGISLTMVSACGLIGSAINLLIFGTLTHLRLRPFLIALTAWDFTLLLISWPIFSLSVLVHNARLLTSGYWAYVYLFCYVGCNIAYTGCVWTTVSLTVERYLAICHPLWHRAMSSAKRIRVAMATVCVVSVIFNAPRYFEYAIETCVKDEINWELLWQLSPTKLLQSKLYLTGYLVVGGCLANTLFPFTLLVGLSMRIFLTLQNHSTYAYTFHEKSQKALKSQKSMTPVRQHSYRRQSVSEPLQRHRMTRMLLVILAKFICCHTLPTAVDIIQAALPDKFLLSVSHRYLVDVSIFLVMLHSASNFLVYAACERQFRAQIVQHFLNCLSIGIERSQRYESREQIEQWAQKDSYQGSNARRHSCAAILLQKSRNVKDNATVVATTVVNSATFRHRKGTV